MNEELVVLLDDDGRAIGTAPKSGVHSTHTPLHRAFSCHLYDESGRTLVTRRALTKKTWPGVWTNAFCGHPGPGESDTDAIVRRAEEELGVRIREIRPVAPEFRYRAVDASGIVENEICPVYSAVIDGDLSPDPGEVAEWQWMDPADLELIARRAPHMMSPWFVEQITWAGALRAAGERTLI